MMMRMDLLVRLLFRRERHEVPKQETSEDEHGPRHGAHERRPEVEMLQEPPHGEIGSHEHKEIGDCVRVRIRAVQQDEADDEDDQLAEAAQPEPYCSQSRRF